MTDYVALVRALARGGVDFLVVGGTAAVLHGASTATYDLDILMPFTPENCERLLSVVGPLHPRYAHLPDRPPVKLTARELEKFKNLYLVTDLGRLDVLGSLPPLDEVPRLFAEAIAVPIDGETVKVLSLEDLLAVKAAMTRPKDKLVEAELRALLDVRKEREKK